MAQNKMTASTNQLVRKQIHTKPLTTREIASAISNLRYNKKGSRHTQHPSYDFNRMPKACRFRN